MAEEGGSGAETALDLAHDPAPFLSTIRIGIILVGTLAGPLYHTLGGVVIIHFELIPASGDHFDWGDLRFEVVDMDYHRVDKLPVTPKKTSGAGQS